MLLTASVSSSWPGDLDTTFGGTGIAHVDFGADSAATAVAMAPDGKIVVAGCSSPTSGTCQFGVARLNDDGTLDTSFGGTGKVTTQLDYLTDDRAKAVAVQMDGKILVTGVTHPGSTAWMVRYNTDGTLDTTFGDNGKAFLYSLAAAHAIAIQPNGKILAGGYTYAYANYDFLLVCLNSNGTLDTTFGESETGRVITNFGYNDEIYGLAIQSDGKIVAVGFADNSGGSHDTALARYNTNGSLDTSFNGTGKVVTSVGLNDIAYGVALQPDGKIVSTGLKSNDGPQRFVLLRYNPGGTLDSTFNGSGMVVAALTSNDQSYAVALQPDGKIVTAGTSGTGTSSGVDPLKIELTRFNANGTPDTTFGGSGLVTTLVNDYTWGHAMALQADGKIVGGGADSSSDMFVARYLSSIVYVPGPNDRFLPLISR